MLQRGITDGFGMKKFFAAIIVLLGMGLLGWQIYEKASASRKDFKRNSRNIPVAVEIEPVRKTDIQNIGKYTGSLYPLSEYIVAPKIGGRLERLYFDIGDTIQTGDLVAVLDDAEYLQQVSQAQAEREVALANLEERRNMLENAKRENRRTVALRKKKIASESELDAADSEYKVQQAKLRVAKAQVAQKNAALKIAKVRLDYARIRVPGSSHGGNWVVGERYVDEGAMLASNTPIISVLDLGTLIAVINVIERDYPKIRSDLTAVISTDAYPGRTFAGKVVRVAPLLKEKSREARIEIEIPNTDMLLKPGMFVRVQIEFDKHKDATVVPAAALLKRNGDRGIFLADLQNKKARFVPVTVGIINGKHVEILNPPITGNVVTLGHHLLEDGSSIILPGKKPGDGKGKKQDKPGIKRGKVPRTGGKS